MYLFYSHGLGYYFRKAAPEQFLEAVELLDYTVLNSTDCFFLPPGGIEFKDTTTK